MMPFPNHIIRKDSTDKVSVSAIQKKLNETGCGPIDVDGDYGNKTLAAVKTFQARFTDHLGNPLKVDGIVGAITWAALFNQQSAPVAASPNSLLQSALDFARAQIGVMEDPLGSNSGKKVNEYQDCAAVKYGDPWCMAFVYWCYNKASEKENRTNPLIKTGGVLDHWNKARCKKIKMDEAANNPGLVKPGHIFILSTSGAFGHTGFVENVSGGILTTIEGNTNDGGSREGIGVFRRQGRKINTINKGFLEYI
jgi:hypothetical protein